MFNSNNSIGTAEPGDVGGGRGGGEEEEGGGEEEKGGRGGGEGGLDKSMLWQRYVSRT